MPRIADAVLAKVPRAQLRSRSGRRRSRRRAGGGNEGRLRAPRRLLLAHADTPVRPAAVVERAWPWSPAAYWPPAMPIPPIGWSQPTRLGRRHRLPEAEFLCGYIALRYRKDRRARPGPLRPYPGPGQQPLRQGARDLLGRARRGRRRGKPDWRRSGTPPAPEHMATFYGQLAAHQLGRDAAAASGAGTAARTAPTQARFNAQELVRARPGLFLPPATATTPGLSCCRWPTRQRRRRLRDAGLARRDRRGASTWRSRWRSARSSAGMPLMVHGLPGDRPAGRRHRRASAAVGDRAAEARLRLTR